MTDNIITARLFIDMDGHTSQRGSKPRVLKIYCRRTISGPASVSDGGMP